MIKDVASTDVLGGFTQEILDETGTVFRGNINGHNVTILKVNYRGKIDYSMYDGCIENPVFVGQREPAAKQMILDFIREICF
jgi:hypothetical protein